MSKKKKKKKKKKPVSYSYEIPQDFDRCKTWDSHTMLAKIFVLFKKIKKKKKKNSEILTSQIGHGFFGVQKLGLYEKPQDFDRC